jgi:hypothetical protein
VDHAGAVSRADGARDLGEEGDVLAERERDLAERLALDERERDVGRPALGARVEDLDDPGVLTRAGSRASRSKRRSADGSISPTLRTLRATARPDARSRARKTMPMPPRPSSSSSS